MREELINFAKNGTVWITLKFYILIILIFTVVAIWKWNKLPPQLPLFYSLPRGSDQLGTPIILLTLPLFSIISFVSNFLLGVFVSKKEKLGATLMIISATAISLLLLITFLQIVFTIT